MATHTRNPRTVKTPRGGVTLRKERERVAHRREIVRAARAVFAEKGFDNATLEEIAARAEFGKGTVYNYFDSKEALFTAAMSDLFDDIMRIATAVCDLKVSARESLAEYMRRMVAYYQANFDFCRKLMGEWVRAELEDFTCPTGELHARIQAIAEPLAKLLRAGMRRKEIRRADPMVLAKMFMGLVHDYYIMNLAPSKRARNIETQVDLVVSVFFDGIAGSESGKT